MKDKLLADPHQIESLRVVVHVPADVVIAIAGASERVFLSLHLDDGDRAPPIALFLPAPAGECLSVSDLPSGKGFEIEGLRRHETLFNPFLDFQGDAERAHQPGFRRDYDRFADQRPHRQRYRAVIAYSALHEDFFPDRPVAFDAVGVVHADRVYQSGSDVLAGHPFVDRVLDIRADKGSALVVEVGRTLPSEGRLSNIIHFQPQRLVGRFFQE